jgi:hypothetical protein
MRKLVFMALALGCFAQNDIVMTDDALVLKNFKNMPTLIINDKADVDSMVINDKNIIVNSEKFDEEAYYREYYRRYYNQ